jgi:hypothetical protein
MAKGSSATGFFPGGGATGARRREASARRLLPGRQRNKGMAARGLEEVARGEESALAGQAAAPVQEVKSRAGRGGGGHEQRRATTRA